MFEKELPDMVQAATKTDPLHRPARSSRFRVAYTAPDGAVEGEFVVTLIVGRFPPHRGPGPSAIWIGEVATCRAPKGKLDALMPTFISIGSSVEPLPDWFNIMVQTAEMFVHQVQQADDQIFKDQSEAIEARMKILRDAARMASADASDRIRQRFADQQKAKDQVQRQFMHYVNDTASFRDPNNGSTVGRSRPIIAISTSVISATLFKPMTRRSRRPSIRKPLEADGEGGLIVHCSPKGNATRGLLGPEPRVCAYNNGIGERDN